MLAVTFNYSLSLGISSTIAIFFHEIPHEIADFAFLYKRSVGFIKVIGF
jgi:zinc transporter 7